MNKYICENCGFLTDNKTDYNRHINTKKHLQKVKQKKHDSKLIPTTFQHDSSNKYSCNHCHNTYSSQSNLTKHTNKCSKKNTQELLIEKDMDNLKKENELLKKQFDEYKEQMVKQLDTYESLLQSAIAPQTINNFTYINNTFPNAPALESRKSYVNLLESKQMTLMEVLSMYYEDKRLVDFVGDYIVKYYKKDKPKDQSLWSSDIARLTYIISQACHKKGNIWQYDKKGQHMKQIIIEPALEYIRQYCYNYNIKNGANSESHILKHMITANEIIGKIDSGELAADIVRYIAPHFTIKQIDNPMITN